MAFDANPTADPWWKLYGGVKGDVGAELRLFSRTVASYSKTVFDWQTVLAQAKIKGDEETSGVSKIYWDGEESLSINSGFNKDGGTARNKVPPPAGHLFLSADSGLMSRCQVAWSTDSAVNLEGYSKVCVEWTNYGSSSDDNESYLIAATNSNDKQENQAASSKVKRTGIFENRVDWIDVSQINEPRYLRVHARDGDYWGWGNTSKLYVNRIWLER